LIHIEFEGLIFFLNIERENVRLGTGGKPLCSECAYLNRMGR